MRILVVMDPPDRIHRYTDTTLAIVEEALRRRHDVSVTTPAELWLDEGELAATYHHALLPPEGAPEPPGLRVGTANAARVAERFDVVLMRKDPPFDLEYHTTTLLLDRVAAKLPVLNAPRGLRECNEKLFILRFPSLVPPTLVTRGRAALVDFMHREGGEMIVKPLHGCGGVGVFRLRDDDPNVHAILETATDMGRRHVMAQRYLPEAQQGDKRILVLDGEPLAAVLRVPRAGETRANFHAGGTPAHAELTERDREIVATIAPMLAEEGLWLVGIDVIGGFLTEINVTSPSGVREIDRLDGGRLETRIVESLERRVSRSKAAAAVDLST